MPAPSETPWPSWSPVIMAAIALVLARLSLRFTGWLRTGLAVGAGVMALLAAVAFWQTWARRR